LVVCIFSVKAVDGLYSFCHAVLVCSVYRNKTVAVLCCVCIVIVWVSSRPVSRHWTSNNESNSSCWWCGFGASSTCQAVA